MLPAAGYRGSSNGALSYRGNNGYYWSSSEGGILNAWSLGFNSFDAYTLSYYRTYGLSVRCIAE
jgi:uncharacterized protein (TIGR02145 family)